METFLGRGNRALCYNEINGETRIGGLNGEGSRGLSKEGNKGETKTKDLLKNIWKPTTPQAS